MYRVHYNTNSTAQCTGVITTQSSTAQCIGYITTQCTRLLTVSCSQLKCHLKRPTRTQTFCLTISSLFSSSSLHRGTAPVTGHQQQTIKQEHTTNLQHMSPIPHRGMYSSLSTLQKLASYICTYVRTWFGTYSWMVSTYVRTSHSAPVLASCMYINHDSLTRKP